MYNTFNASPSGFSLCHSKTTLRATSSAIPRRRFDLYTLQDEIYTHFIPSLDFSSISSTSVLKDFFGSKLQFFNRFLLHQFSSLLFGCCLLQFVDITGITNVFYESIVLPSLAGESTVSLWIDRFSQGDAYFLLRILISC
ncbi:hypothetical protein L6452_15760 [Arctium lappa]|uniref:Uncharacterized protein n=1 Tax=Arctium lappa TaxID=4217 RepID=A0ACB9CPJ6_ARCLA|nr:hypothetical protein L6452_15760 [Arctium lappa]